MSAALAACGHLRPGKLSCLQVCFLVLQAFSVTNLFKRNNAPTLPTLEVICSAFGITLAQFFAEGGEAVEITDEQRELFAKWSTLTEKQKALLLEFISTLQ